MNSIIYNHYDDACKQSTILTSSTAVTSLMSSTASWAILNSLSLGSSTDVTHSPNVSFFSCHAHIKVRSMMKIWYDTVHTYPIMMKYDMMHWVYSYTVVYVEWREMMYSHIMYTQLNNDEGMYSGVWGWCLNSNEFVICSVIYNGIHTVSLKTCLKSWQTVMTVI